MANVPDAPKFRKDSEGVGSYYQVSEKVAYSVSLSDLVIADFDAGGAFRGIEFIGKQTAPVDKYVAMARKASLGPMRKTRGAIPGLAKSA